MSSGQEIVERILRSYNVDFDSTVSGKLNEFMVRSAVDILKSAKRQAIFARKPDLLSLFDVRLAINEMKENRNVEGFEQIGESRRQIDESSSASSLLFFNNDSSDNHTISHRAGLRMKFSAEEKRRIKQLIEDDKKRLSQDKKNIKITDLFTQEARQRYFQQEQAAAIQPMQPDKILPVGISSGILTGSAQQSVQSLSQQQTQYEEDDDYE